MPARLSTFTTKFLDALAQIDIAALPQYCQFPLLLTTPAGSVILQSADDAIRMVTLIRNYYLKFDLKGFEAQPLEMCVLSESAALIRTHMNTTNTSGDVIADGHYTFILSRGDSGYKVISVLADGPAALRLAEEYPHESWAK